MKLALIIERFDPEGGGAERSTAQIAGHLVARDHAVTVLAAWRGVEDVPGLRIIARGERRRLGAWHLWRFAAWARRQLDIGAFDASLSMTTAVPATVLQPRSGTVRETAARNVALGGSGAARRLAGHLRLKHRVQLRLERAALSDPRVRRIIAVSAYVQRQLREHYGICDGVEVIDNAAEMPAPDDALRAVWRRSVRGAFGLDEDTPAFLFAAHNPRLKGSDTLLAALGILRRQGVPVVVFVAGDISYRLQRRAATLGVRADLRFVGTTRHMAALYCAADVTVHPTWYDPSSKVVIESLLMGCPAITTAFNGAAEVLERAGADGPAGRVLADPADAGALAGAMASLADPRARLACRPAGPQLATQLSMARHVARLESVLREAAGGVAGGVRSGV